MCNHSDSKHAKGQHQQNHSRQATHQSQESVCIEDEVSLVGVDVPDDGVHAPGLVVARQNLEVVIDASQIWLLQLHPYVLSDEVNCDNILLPTLRACCWTLCFLFI